MLLQVLITIGAAQALNLALLSLLKSKREQSDYLLSLELFAIFTVIMLFNYKAELSDISLYLPLMTFIVAYLAVSLFYLYIKSMVRGRLDFHKPQQWLHFIPALVALTLYLSQFAPLSPEEKLKVLELVKSENTCPTWFYFLSYGLFLGVFPIYLYKSYRLIRIHEFFIRTRFSFTEDVSLAWLYHFLISQTIVWLGFLAFEVVGSNFLGIIPVQTGFKLAFLFLIGSIFLQGYFGLRRGVAFVQMPHTEVPEEETVKYQGSSLSSARVRELGRQLSRFMEEEKPYLEAKVTIGDLAQRIGWPVNDLSRVINEGLGQNFYDFINSYRVAEFKELLIDPDNHQYTLLSLAHDAGFNSKSTFNAIFKKFTGMTPSEYSRHLRLQQVS
jgi:AraC-like DNA-binding protein